MSKIVDDAIIKQLRGEITQEQLIAILTEQGVIRPDPSTIIEPEQSDKVTLKYRSMMDELTKLNVLPLMELQNFGALTGLWFDTRHPYYLNRACAICEKYLVSVPELLNDEMMELGKQLVSGKVQKRPKDTKPERDIINGNAMRIVANLIHVGATLDEAAAKVATLYSEAHPELPIKTASGIERDYSEKWRATGIEKMYLDEWTRTDEMYFEWRNEWKKIRRDTPEAKGRLKGNRRK